jgi:hypothetical protein
MSKTTCALRRKANRWAIVPSAALCGVLLAALGAGAEEWKLPAPMDFSGARYEAEVPDTLDLAERAALAINAMTRVVDPARDYEVYFNTEFARKPPVLWHRGVPDYEGAHMKFLESLPLVRIISGSAQNIDVDHKMMGAILRMTGPDGLFYMPWDRLSTIPDYMGGVGEEGGQGAVARAKKPFTSIWFEGRSLLAMCIWSQRDKDPRWQRLCEKKIDRLLALAVKKDNYCYFSRGRFYILGDEAPVDGPMPGDIYPIFSGALMHGAAAFYKQTGYPPALELAGRLARGVHEHANRFDREGRFLFNHFHHSCYALIGMLEYASAANDQELIKFVQKGYEYGKTIGEPLVGFYPELPGTPGPDGKLQGERRMSCETCEVADMIVLGLKLTKLGVGDYWEDVDRVVRNQFVENQLLRTDWIDRVSKNAAPVRPCDDSKDVVERNVGAWAGWAYANDFNPLGIMHCCTGNAARTLYYVWDSILTPEGDKVRVNLLLNRASPYLDLDSYLPCEGKAVLKIKQAKAVAVRIPSWTDRAAVRCMVNGQPREFTWSGNYLETNGLQAGDAVTMTFPMRQSTVSKQIGAISCKLTLKGNTVVAIEPKGTVYPLYERQKYISGQTPMKKISRFVSTERIAW